MLLPIKPVIDRRPRRNGTSLISIQYCFSSDKRTLLYTGLAVPPEYWNKKLLRISRELPQEFGGADQLNLQLQKMIRTAEDIVNFALRQKVEDPVAFKILDEETDAIYLTSKEIDALYKVKLSAYPHLERFRDMFVLGCLTGLRFSDYSSIRPEDIRNGMLYKKQGKSDHWVVIPLRAAAYDIINIRYKNKIPKITNEELNRHIKKIGQLAGINIPIKVSYKKGNQDIVVTKPKLGWITSHTCRRSFCTNEFLAGTPPELIMKISGHKRCLPTKYTRCHFDEHI